MFNYHISKMRDTGILDRLALKWLSPPNPQPPEDANKVAEALGGTQVFVPFTILLLGIGACTSMFLAEKNSLMIRSAIETRLTGTENPEAWQ